MKNHLEKKPAIKSKAAAAGNKQVKPAKTTASKKLVAKKPPTAKTLSAKPGKASVKSGKSTVKSITAKKPVAKSAVTAKRATAPIAKSTAIAKRLGTSGVKAKSKPASAIVAANSRTVSVAIKPAKRKEKTLRTKVFPPLHAQLNFGFPENTPELPLRYNDNRLVLMPKDPEYMFCYWEVTPELLAGREKEKLTGSFYRETLRIEWELQSASEPNFQFIPVTFLAKKWYFGIPQIGHTYQADLGWVNDAGHFISILRSNPSDLPENWSVTRDRLRKRGGALAHSAGAAGIMGGSERGSGESSRGGGPGWNLNSESLISRRTISVESSAKSAKAAGTAESSGPSKKAVRDQETPAPRKGNNRFPKNDLTDLIRA